MKEKKNLTAKTSQITSNFFESATLEQVENCMI
jgi:hypothetical protein